jgi:DNA-binding CsgD family transcriptional regulator
MVRESAVALKENPGVVHRRSEKAGSSDDVQARIARLSSGQLGCLRLVNAHHSSKEIAAELQISPHTVDQRVRGALHILGVERRTQAARLVAEHCGPYQRLIHQSPHIEAGAAGDHSDGAVSIQIRHADRAGEDEGAGFPTEQRVVTFAPPLQLPFATRNNPRNEMSVGQRLFWIAAIAIGAAFSAGMYLAGLESLSRLLNS